jgi:hypothetical protein
MKTLKCHKCETYLGEIERGKVKKDCIFICKACLAFYETCDSLNKYNKSTQPDTGGLEFLKDLLSGNKK